MIAGLTDVAAQIRDAELARNLAPAGTVAVFVEEGRSEHTITCRDRFAALTFAGDGFELTRHGCGYIKWRPR